MSNQSSARKSNGDEQILTPRKDKKHMIHAKSQPIQSNIYNESQEQGQPTTTNAQQDQQDSIQNLQADSLIKSKSIQSKEMFDCKQNQQEKSNTMTDSQSEKEEQQVVQNQIEIPLQQEEEQVVQQSDQKMNTTEQKPEFDEVVADNWTASDTKETIPTANPPNAWEQESIKDTKNLSNESTEFPQQQSKSKTSASGKQDNSKQQNNMRNEQEKTIANRKVFCSNLDFSTTWTDLKDFMKKVGDVVRADIFFNREGKSRGMGVVEFENIDGAQAAVNDLAGVELNGRKCYVKFDNTVMRPRENRGDSSQQQRSSDNPRYDQKRNWQSNDGRRDGNYNRQNGNSQGWNREDSDKRERNFEQNHRSHGNQNGRRRRSQSANSSGSNGQNGSANQNGNYRRRQDWSRDEVGQDHQNRGYNRDQQSGYDRNNNRRGQWNSDRQNDDGRRNNREYVSDETRSPNCNTNSRVGENILQIQRRRNSPSPQPQYTPSFRQGRQVFVGNMPFSVTENQFLEAFREFGKILEARILTDNVTKVSRGQGTVLFQEREQAEEASRVMDQARFNDRVVLVRIDRQADRTAASGNHDSYGARIDNNYHRHQQQHHNGGRYNNTQTQAGSTGQYQYKRSAGQRETYENDYQEGPGNQNRKRQRLDRDLI